MMTISEPWVSIEVQKGLMIFTLQVVFFEFSVQRLSEHRKGVRETFE